MIMQLSHAVMIRF